MICKYAPDLIIVTLNVHLINTLSHLIIIFKIISILKKERTKKIKKITGPERTRLPLEPAVNSDSESELQQVLEQKPEPLQEPVQR